jgi:AraC family transcriptional regulator of adaptative response/methylated-DNA-[protein]-cysteine methyltransferase
VIDAKVAWAQLQSRDANATFFYGVLTTGVFCRPNCASRRPLRENVRFFATAEEAQAAGFRPCKRCHPGNASGSDLDGAAIDRVRAHIEANLDRAVPLDELGRIAGMSPFTVQRRFKAAMGATPLSYQRALRATAFRRQLKEGGSVTDAIYNAGFGSSSRAYEDAGLGMTPARFAQGGRGERISWSSALSPFGWVIVGATARGLCWLSLAASSSEGEAALRAEFPAAEIVQDASLAHWVDAAVGMVRGEEEESRLPQPGLSHPSRENKNGARVGRPDLECLDLRGTAFQLRVWNALRQIPRGQTVSYSQLARDLGNANATRAVARACATNRVALLVPCHRVVGVSGALTGYRWGVERKRQLLEAELLG